MDRSAPDDEFITAGSRPAGPGETPVPELSVPGTSKTLQQHPKEDEALIVDDDGRKKSVGEETEQAQGKYGELRDRAGQVGAKASQKAQDYADTDSPQESEEKKMGMRERMRQMGVSPIFVLYLRIYFAYLGHYRIMFGYVGPWLEYTSHIPICIRKVCRIVFLNNARTRQTTCLSVAGVCSPRNIFLLSAVTNSFSVAKRSLIYFLVLFARINLIDRLSLNAKGVMITKKPSAGSSIISSSMLKNLNVISLESVNNIVKRPLRYLLYPLSLLFFLTLILEIKLEPCDG